jgi:hypothetical protein
MRQKAALIAWLARAPVVALAAGDLPAGWIKAGGSPNDYEMGVDTSTRHGGRASAFVKFTAKEVHTFGTLMQTSGPGEYLGKRVRLSGYVKSEKIDNGWAGLWLRVDGPSTQPLAFDNMQGRPLKGTTDWKRVEIVLDVPSNAVNLAFGVLLAGDGEVWMDDLKFEVVSRDVPVTNIATGQKGPSNLDFEK